MYISAVPQCDSYDPWPRRRSCSRRRRGLDTTAVNHSHSAQESSSDAYQRQGEQDLCNYV